MTVFSALIARPMRWALILAAILTVALWIVTLSQLHLARDMHMHATERNLMTVTRSLHAHADKTMQLADQAATFILLDYDIYGRNLDLKQLIRHRALTEDIFNFFAVADPQGNIILSSQPLKEPVNIADRDHFKVHQDNNSALLYVGEPAIGRVTGRETIHLSRRLNAPDGSFAGVVVVSMNPYYFTEVYRSLQLGEESVISLWRDDGLGLVRRSDNEQAMGLHLPDASFLKAIKEGDIAVISSKSPVDNVERLWAFKRIHQTPLLVSVGLSMAQENKPFLKLRTPIYLLAFLLTLIIFTFAIVVGRFIEKLTDSRRQAIKANNAKSEFLSNVSHELRSPLSSILGYAELLELQEQESEKRSFISYIHQSGAHLLALVNSLLALNQIEKGQIEVSLGPIQIRELIQELIGTQTQLAQRRGLALSSNVAPSVPEVIYSDRIKLTQILHNLLQNAIKFTESGSITVTVQTDATHMQIEVTDTGCGISDSHQLVVFDRFFQAPNNTADTLSQGLGLGLAIARQLVQLLGGSITVDSTLGQGSTFTVIIPLASATASPTTNPPSIQTRGQPS